MRESVAAPPRLRRARRADPARALADQPQVDLRDREGRRRLPDDELPRRLRRPGRRDADVQQLRPAPEPALRHRHDHHPGARARPTIELGAARSAARLLLLHRRRSRPPHRRLARQARRGLRLRPGREHLDGRLGRPDPADRRGGRPLAGRARDRHERRPLPAGRERGRWRCASATRSCARETGWEPKVSWEEGVRRTIAWYAANPRELARARRLADGRAASSSGERPRHRRGRLPRLVPRRAAARPGRRGRRRPPSRLRPDALGRRRAACSPTRSPRSSSTSPPRSAASARTAPIPAATGTRT